jgi:DNA-binding NarL/FixJ family response regulator
VFRKGLVDLISDEDNFEVIAEAENGKEAIMQIKKYQPEIAILDINMPLINGFEVAKELNKAKAKTKIIFLTMHKEENILNKALDFRAKGYILKECAIDDIINCINYVSQDKQYISPAISELLVKRTRLFKGTESKLDKLTLTEKKILSLIAEEKTSREIAEQLFVSIRTVENHRINICHKLELSGINSLLKFVIENKHLF